MYFKQLEIFGFKSFADKTVLNFESGITAIIGPNGCGKSNVFDAIRWVLGEQSVKELRGASMEDVIFNGTDNKPALGFAEVSLTFSNDSKTLPVEYDEVTITRRLFRSGESEYLLNKTPVRLKDIVELIMGTGIGAEAYSLVQQGKVDLVVSAKPEDRRIILDEASGITKYKAKKREALNKLKDTEQNLLRINDIIIEVKRQIASIERQAKKAQRYKGEFEKLKGMEVNLANHHLSSFSKERENVNKLLEQYNREETTIAEELNQLNEVLSQENNLLEELEEKVSEVKAEDIKLDGQVDINNRQIGFNEERIENVSSNERKIEENKTQLIERCRIQRDKIEEVKRSLEELKGVMSQNADLLVLNKENLEVIIGTIRAAKETISQEEEKILDISTKQVSVKNDLTEIMKHVQGGIARKRRLDVEKTKVLNEKEEIDRRLENINSKIINAKAHCEKLRAELENKNQVLKEQVTRIAHLDNTIDELEKKKLFLISQKEFIEKLSVQYQDIPDPTIVGRLITDSKPLDHHSGIIGKVKEVLPIDSDKLRSLKGNFPEDVTQLYEIICETKFIELDPQQINFKIDEMSSEIEQKIREKDELDSMIKEQRFAIKQTELNIQEENNGLSIYEAQKKEVSDESDKLVEELELLIMEIEEVTETLNTTKKKEEEQTFKLDSLNQELAFSQMKIKEKQELIAAKSFEREETTVAIAQLETEISSVEDKENTHHENLKMYTETMDSSLEEIKRIEEDFVDLEDKKKIFRSEIEELHTKILKLKDQKESLREVLIHHEKQKENVIEKISAAQGNISEHIERNEVLKEKIHSGQMGEQEVTFKEKEIKDRLLQTYKIDMDIVLAGTDQERPIEGQQEEGETPAESFNVEEITLEIEKLKKRCDSFGSVNLVAIEEFEELKERFEFLTKQQSDLLTAKESLHSTIRKINRQTRQMFMDTFTKVSEEFRIYFRMLFGGGEAQLVLLDPENVLESGIDIIARPPGKKLQNISLLSGGEKTLTAIALIFGVFKVNPSPFCVLDEIDAALDESNVGRFSYLLKDFSKIAQFIVITHNKKTISSANVMYGVTMQEMGVSKVVSVKFDDSEESQQANDSVAIGV